MLVLQLSSNLSAALIADNRLEITNDQRQSRMQLSKAKAAHGTSPKIAYILNTAKA
jgi:hypothetical protein